MEQRAYDAAQQGLMASMIGAEQEANLQRFLEGLRRSSEWTSSQVAEVEAEIHELLGVLEETPWASEKQFRLSPSLRESKR